MARLAPSPGTWKTDQALEAALPEHLLKRGPKFHAKNFT